MEERQERAFHPFLFAIFPVLSLLSRHIDHVSIDEAYLPLTGMLVACGVLWFFAKVVLPNQHKRGILLLLCLSLFWSYGPLIDTARATSSGVIAAAICIVALLLALALRSIIHSKRELHNATFLLNRIALCAVVLAVSTVAVKAWSSHTTKNHPAATSSLSVRQENSEPVRPDIYYIILDAYTREDTLRALFNYDNSPFLAFLRDHGFYVADKSYSNYPWTLFSLSSSLNMDYLNAGAPEGESQRDFDIRVQKQFRTNKVMRFLQQRGYECISFTSGYSATDGMESDVTLKPGLLLGEFHNVLINMTPLRTVLGRMEYASQQAMHRKRILFTLDRLAKLERRQKPLFVFAHVTIPHPPFVLDQDGRSVHNDRPFVLTDGDNFFKAGGTEKEYIDGYTAQLTYVNKRVMAIVEKILAKSPDAVILLQGDHGSRLRLSSELATTDLREAFSILNAFRLPDRDADALLNASISPVNAFRTIFNAYFGTSYPMLENHSFSGEGASNFRLKEITERLR